MPSSDHLHLEDCRVERLTEKAILIKRPSGATHWIPQSQVANDCSKLDEGDEGVTISVTEWFATKEGIEEDE